MPLPDGRLVPRAPAPAAAAPRVVPRRLARAPAAPLLLPLAVRPDVGAGASHRNAGRLQARHGARRLPPASPRLRLAPADAPAVPRAARRRRRVARLPVPGGQPHLGRHDREHAHRGVLVHLRRRPRRPLPGRSLPGPCRRPRALGSRRRPRPHLLRPRLRRALGGPHRLGAPAVGSPTRGRAGPRDLEDAGLARGRGRARLCPRRARPRAPPGGLGLDDALRRRVDRDHDAGALPGAPLAALPRRGRRARGAPRAPPGEAPGRTPAPARLRRARRRRAGRRRARASGSWTCASCPSRSSRSPSPARPASASPSPAWPSPTWRPSASSWSPRPTPTRARRVLRHWVDWNYSGLEAKELWPAWQELNARLRGGPSDPRVAFEYSPVHERAGSLRMHEMVPFFSGRSGIEGVYSQSSTTTHPVYYLLSELLPSSSNPFRSRSYSRFDLPSGLARLRLFGVGQIVATSPALVEALDARPEVVREARIPPYTLFRLADPGPGIVEPLAFAPVRASPRAWRDQAYRWVSRKPPNRAVLVFTEDPRFDVVADRPLGAAARAPAARRGRGDGGGRGGGDPHHDEPAGPPAPRQGLLPPALEGRGRRRALPRLARPHADRPLAARGEAHLRGARVVRSRRPRPRPGGRRPAPGRDRGPVAAGQPRSPRVGLPRAVSWPCRSRSSWRSPRCASFRGPRTPPRRTASTSGPRGPTPPSGGRRPPSTPATPSRARARRRTPGRAELLCVRGEALLRAGHAREAVEAFTLVVEDGRGTPPAGPALGSPRPGGGGRPRGGGRVATAGSGRSTPRRRGPAVSSRR